MRRWVQEGWSLRFIFNYALALHGSYLNNKSAPLPENAEVRLEVERFLRRLGYRFVLRELRHSSVGRAGAPFDLRMKWQNTGSAPCYRPYRVAYRFTHDQGYSLVRVGGLTADAWRPGEVPLFTEDFFKEPPDLPAGELVEVVDRVELPTDMPPGRYRLAIGVVGDKSDEPVISLAIQGRTQDRWYPLSEIEVSRL